MLALNISYITILCIKVLNIFLDTFQFVVSHNNLATKVAAVSNFDPPNHKDR